MTEEWKDYIFRYTDTYEYMERLKKGLPPAILCVSINGGVQGKEYNPAIPEHPDEIAESVLESYNAGASMVHIHARDPHHISQDAKTTETWIEVNRKVRDLCPNIIINNTTGGGLSSTMEERLACLDAGPEVASLNVVPDMSQYKMKARKPPLPDPHPAIEYNDCVPYTYETITNFAKEMKRRGIKPEIETYHPGGAWVINHLIEEGLLEKPYWIQTVMGYQTSSYPTISHILHLLQDLPQDTMWLASGVGPYQLPVTTLAAIMGGHIRIGLEDNIYYSKGQLAESNTQLVARAARIVKEVNREVATPSQARKMLGLSSNPSKIP